MIKVSSLAEDRDRLRAAMATLTGILTEINGMNAPLLDIDYEINCQSDESLAKVAEAILKKRTLRAKKFGVSIFGEPSWDILLYLFIQTVNGNVVPVSSACTAGETAPTTGMRYISIMCNAGLIERSASRDDRRVQYLKLTARGIISMREYLSDLN